MITPSNAGGTGRKYSHWPRSTDTRNLEPSARSVEEPQADTRQDLRYVEAVLVVHVFKYNTLSKSSYHYHSLHIRTGKSFWYRPGDPGTWNSGTVGVTQVPSRLGRYEKPSSQSPQGLLRPQLLRLTRLKKPTPMEQRMHTYSLKTCSSVQEDMKHGVYMIGSRHIHTHITTPRGHACTHQAIIQETTLAHVTINATDGAELTRYLQA